VNSSKIIETQRKTEDGNGMVRRKKTRMHSEGSVLSSFSFCGTKNTERIDADRQHFSGSNIGHGGLMMYNPNQRGKIQDEKVESFMPPLEKKNKTMLSPTKPGNPPGSGRDREARRIQRRVSYEQEALAQVLRQAQQQLRGSATPPRISPRIREPNISSPRGPPEKEINNRFPIRDGGEGGVPRREKRRPIANTTCTSFEEEERAARREKERIEADRQHVQERIEADRQHMQEERIRKARGEERGRKP